MADTSDAEPLSWPERLLAWAVFRAAASPKFPGAVLSGDLLSAARAHALSVVHGWAEDDRRALATAMDCLTKCTLVSRDEYWTETVGGPSAESEPPLGVGA